MKAYKIRSKNILIMYSMEVFDGLLFFLPILALYLEQNLFSITNVAIVFAVEAAATAILEVPTGAIADLFGRKRTLMLSKAMQIIGITLLYIGGSMTVFIVFAILRAFYRSLQSGTDHALIYDTLKEEKKEKYYKKICGNYSAIWPFGAIAGSLIGGWLASISLSLPILMTLIPVSIVFFLTFFLKEPEYEKEKNKNVLKHMFNSSKLILGKTQLLLIFTAGLLLYGIGESVHYLNSIFFTFKQIPIALLGVIAAFVFGFSSLGHYLSHFVSEKLGNKKTLIFASLGTPIFLLISIFSDKYIAALFWAVASIFYGLRNPVISHLINSEVSSKKRATVISISNFINNIGMTILVPLIGWVAELYTITTAFLISAVFIFIVPVIYSFIKDKK